MVAAVAAEPIAEVATSRRKPRKAVQEPAPMAPEPTAMDPGPKDMSTVKKTTRWPRVTKAKAQIPLAVDDGAARLGDSEPGMTMTINPITIKPKVVQHTINTDPWEGLNPDASSDSSTGELFDNESLETTHATSVSHPGSVDEWMDGELLIPLTHNLSSHTYRPNYRV